MRELWAMTRHRGWRVNFFSNCRIMRQIKINIDAITQESRIHSNCHLRSVRATLLPSA